jgi:hypothetical protein
MPRYLIRSFVMVYYDHDIEADTLEDAVQLVEHGEDDGVERDNSAPVAYEYAVNGQMGWSAIPDEPEIPRSVGHGTAMPQKGD